MPEKRSVVQTAEVISDKAIVNLVLEGIREKKGFDIAILDLTPLRNVVASYFVICSGNSDTQTQAIADAIQKSCKENAGFKAWKSEGYNRGEWILLDFVDVVVHIFIPRIRQFYALEELWGDAAITRYAE